MNTRRRLASIVVVVFALLALWAVPAGAVTTVVADEQFKWFYWVGPLLVLSIIGLLFAMAFGYYVRVLRPRSRGRRVS